MFDGFVVAFVKIAGFRIETLDFLLPCFLLPWGGGVLTFPADINDFMQLWGHLEANLEAIFP